MDCFSQLYQLKSSSIGVLGDENGTTVIPQIFDEYSNIYGSFTQWNEELILRFNWIIQKLQEVNTSKSEELISKIIKLRDFELQKDEFQNIEITFCCKDIAPKNILVNRG